MRTMKKKQKSANWKNISKNKHMSNQNLEELITHYSKLDFSGFFNFAIKTKIINSSFKKPFIH